MKYFKRQEGMVLPLVLGLVALVVVVVGVAVWQSQKAKQAASSPTPTPVVQASSTPTASPDSYAVAIAAADQYCKTHPDARGSIDGSLIFKASTVGPDKKPALYSTNKSFALLQGACFVPGTGAYAGGDGAWVVKLSGATGQVVDVTQESFHADKVQLYNIPDYSDFK